MRVLCGTVLDNAMQRSLQSKTMGKKITVVFDVTEMGRKGGHARAAALGS